MGSTIKEVDSKVKLAKLTVIGTLIAAVIIVAIVMVYDQHRLDQSKKEVYVLANNIPLKAMRVYDTTSNRMSEYRGVVEDFHHLFFCLPPDDKYIQYQMGQAMYLIDASGIAQYNTLKEKGFFNTIVSTSTTITLVTDSIKVNMDDKSFIYYGTEKLQRPSNITIRSLITSGHIMDVPRTDNNPHGAEIVYWKTLENKDISSQDKSVY